MSSDNSDNDTFKFSRFVLFMANALLLGLFYCSNASATMYSCVDSNGAKVLKNSPCEIGQKQKTIERKVITDSRTKIDSTGEVQQYNSQEPQVERPARALTQIELHAQRCEEMYQQATDRNSSVNGNSVGADMWIQMGCKGHCGDLYNAVSDRNSSVRRREVSSLMFSACK